MFATLTYSFNTKKEQQVSSTVKEGTEDYRRSRHKMRMQKHVLVTLAYPVEPKTLVEVQKSVEKI